MSIQQVIQDHINSLDNPHNIDKEKLGLAVLENYPLATAGEAIDGTAHNRYMTVERAHQLVGKILYDWGIIDEEGNPLEQPPEYDERHLPEPEVEDGTAYTAPEWITAGGDLGIWDQTVDLQLEGSSYNSFPLTYHFKSGDLPVGVEMTETGLIQGDIEEEDAGYDFTIKLTDGFRSVEQSFFVQTIQMTLSFGDNVEQVWSFTGHTDSVYGVAVDSEGYVYSGSADETVRKISPDGNEIWSFTGHVGGYTHSSWGDVYGVAVDSAGFVYSASWDFTLRKISPEGNQVWMFTGHSGRVYDVAVDSAGFVYSVSLDDTVRKISPEGNEVWAFTGHTASVYSVAVDSDGFVYSGSVDNTVRKISPDGNEVWSFAGHTNNVYGVAVDSDGYVYSGAQDETVRKISPEGNEIWSFTGHTSFVREVAVDSAGFVYSVSYDNTVRKISPEGVEVWSFTGHTGWVNGVAVDPEGFVYSGSTDDTLRKLRQFD